MIDLFEYEDLSLSDIIRELKNKLIEYEHLEQEQKVRKEELEQELIGLAETLIILLKDEYFDPVEKRIL